MAKAKCQVCKKEVDKSELTTCLSCGRKYCPDCQSTSTNKKYCKGCVE